MKNALLYFFSACLFLGAAGCRKDTNDLSQQEADEALILSIAGDRDKEEVRPSLLPEAILNFIPENNFDTYAEGAFLAREKGYEVVLSTEERLYFDRNGRHLRHRNRPQHGACGPLGGEAIRPNTLPQALLDYVAANYPTATIRAAKMRGDKIIVALTGQILLVFSQDGAFIEEALFWHDCRPCQPGSVVDLPDDVDSFIAAEYPGAEVHRVCRRGDRIVIGITTPDGRKILVFDQNWTFLYAVP